MTILNPAHLFSQLAEQQPQRRFLTLSRDGAILCQDFHLTDIFRCEVCLQPQNFRQTRFEQQIFHDAFDLTS